jgi:hypothetical protein
VTALPSNLAMVGDDLARATLRDARRSVKRRRLVTCAVACALLALTASAGIANGWLSEETPTAKALPSLTRGANGADLRTLMTELGPERRVLSSVPTAGGAICLVLTGYQMQCVPTFTPGQQLVWFVWSSQGGPTVVWGVVRDTVTAVEAISTTGQVANARLENGAYYVELTDGLPARLIAHLSDGSSAVVRVAECPLDDPDCPD